MRKKVTENFIAKVKELYPDTDISRSVRVEDHLDGEGPVLVHWALPSDPPADEIIE